MYRIAHENESVPQYLLELANHTEAQYELVDEIVDIGEADDGIFLQVRWMGLPDIIDHTWVKLEDLNEDIPDALALFLSKHKKNKKLVKKAKATIGLREWTNVRCTLIHGAV